MKQEWKPLSWKVACHDCNADEITYYDVLKYREDFVKKLKKKCATKEEFAEKMRRELMWSYWSKCEWEIIIEMNDDGHVWLEPFVGSRDSEKVKIDITDRTDFDWVGFAQEHIGRQRYKNYAKIDVWDQISYRWDEFIEYVWSYRHKYQRGKKVEMT